MRNLQAVTPSNSREDMIPHFSAIADPTVDERPIVEGLGAWKVYADRYNEGHGIDIGTDSAIAPPWIAWGVALRELLVGEIGRLDPGTIDTWIGDVFKSHGLDSHEPEFGR